MTQLNPFGPVGTTGAPAVSTAPPPVAGPSGVLGLVQQFATPFLAQHGLMPNQFTPQQSFYDQAQGLRFAQEQMQAMSLASQPDRAVFERFLVGLNEAQGVDFDTSEGRRRMEQIQTMSGDFAAMAPTFMQLAGPHAFNQIFGTQGSAAVGATGVLRGGQLFRDPTTGQMGFTGETAATIAQSLAENTGLNTGEAGLLFESLAKRGLVGPRGTTPERQLGLLQEQSPFLGETGVDIRSQVDQVQRGIKSASEALEEIPDLDASTLQAEARQISEKMNSLKGAFEASKEIFGPDASPEQLVQGINNLTQGGLRRLSGEELERELRMTQATMSITGLAPSAFVGFQGQVAGLTDRMRLGREFAPGIARSSALFGAALRESGALEGGFGQLDEAALRGLDAQLRAGAAQSPLAGNLGAVLNLSEMGLVGESSRAGRLAEALRAGETTFEGRSLAQMSRADIMRIMQSSGVSEADALSALDADNQQFIEEAGVEDTVRRVQFEADIVPLFTQSVSRALGGRAGGDLSGDVIQAALSRGGVQERQAAVMEALRGSDRFADADEGTLRSAASRVLNEMSAQRRRDPRLRGLPSMEALADLFDPAAAEELQETREQDMPDVIEDMRELAGVPATMAQRISQQLMEGGGTVADMAAAVFGFERTDTPRGRAMQRVMQGDRAKEPEETGPRRITGTVRLTGVEEAVLELTPEDNGDPASTPIGSGGTQTGTGD